MASLGVQSHLVAVTGSHVESGYSLPFCWKHWSFTILFCRLGICCPGRKTTSKCSQNRTERFAEFCIHLDRFIAVPLEAGVLTDLLPFTLVAELREGASGATF